jgi:hypothetical protein
MVFDSLSGYLALAASVWPSRHDDPRPPCPYCREPLPEKATRTTRCGSCGNRVHVRAGRRMTDYEARAVDILKSLGVPHQTSLMFRSCMWEDSRPRSLNDVARETLDAVISRTDDHAARRRLYYDRARVTAAEGHDPAVSLRESARSMLLEWRGLFPAEATVAISVRPGACATCRALGGRQLRLEDALAENLIPVVGCTTRTFAVCRHPWCRCFYSPPSVVCR